MFSLSSITPLTERRRGAGEGRGRGSFEGVDLSRKVREKGRERLKGGTVENERVESVLMMRGGKGRGEEEGGKKGR